MLANMAKQKLKQNKEKLYATKDQMSFSFGTNGSPKKKICFFLSNCVSMQWCWFLEAMK